VRPTNPLLLGITLKELDFLVAVVALIVLSGSCQDRKSIATSPPAGATSAPANAATAPAEVSFSAQKWLGQWNGPEGTFLRLSQNGSHYVVEIQSLDSLDTYVGVASAGGIQFTRNGKTESIRAGSGEDTGMKWLLDDKNCLIIKYGEGFCRN
jgi:hypothetical protein